MSELTVVLTVGGALIGTLVGAVLVYLATRQKTRSDEGVARTRLEDDATLAREKLLAEATAALQEQQGRYIQDLQAQATAISLRLRDVDAKLQEAQIAIVLAVQEKAVIIQEKAELSSQLKANLFELGQVNEQLREARAKLQEAQAANRVLLDRLSERRAP